MSEVVTETFNIINPPAEGDVISIPATIYLTTGCRSFRLFLPAESNKLYPSEEFKGLSLVLSHHHKNERFVLIKSGKSNWDYSRFPPIRVSMRSRLLWRSLCTMKSSSERMRKDEMQLTMSLIPLAMESKRLFPSDK